MTEIWKAVAGYEGIYEISNLGTLRSLTRKTNHGKTIYGRTLSTKTNNRGYIQVCLSSVGKQDYRLLHRLVAEAFVPNEKGLPQVNHKDEDKDNNRAENLEWCTNLYNRHYGTGLSRAAENHDYDQIAEKNRRTIKQFDKNGNLLNVRRGLKSAQDASGVHESNIRRCCCGRGTSAGGYVWQYA